MTKPDHVDLTAPLRWTAAHLEAPVTEVRKLEGGSTGVMLALRSDRHNEAVLRLITEEPWRTHGEALSTREGEIQQMLASSPVPSPMSLALDAKGDHCGHPAHLMTLLPGAVNVDRIDKTSLAALARLLATIHDVDPTIEVRPYQSWAWQAKFVVPTWAEHPDLWSTAFDILRTEPPSFEPLFIHRDFALRNVLWSNGSISGVVDWVEASIGPAWLDVAHCCTNIAMVHGNKVADLFATAYIERTGREAQPYFDVMDVVGFLPPPGKSGFFNEDGKENRRLEQRLHSVMVRMRG